MEQPKIVYSVTEQALQAQLDRISAEGFRTADALETAILDVSEADHLKSDDAIAALLIHGTIMRRRQIQASRAVKAAKAAQEKQAQYSKWVAANPTLALNPTTNLTMQLAYGVIDRAAFDNMTKAVADAAKPAEQTAPAAPKAATAK